MKTSVRAVSVVVIVFTPKGCGWRLEQWKAGLSASSGVSASPSSLESRPPSPAAATQLCGDGSGLGAEAGAGARGRGLEVEVVEPGTLEWTGLKGTVKGREERNQKTEWADDTDTNMSDKVTNPQITSFFRGSSSKKQEEMSLSEHFHISRPVIS